LRIRTGVGVHQGKSLVVGTGRVEDFGIASGGWDCVHYREAGTVDGFPKVDIVRAVVENCD
jgi:hypothetical protein